jgi:hypothetical protein
MADHLRILSCRDARVMRRPFAVVAAWDFVASLPASPGLDVLVPGDRHADVAAQALAQFPDLAGNMTHDAHTPC